MYCSKCGQPNADTAKFCTSCGSQLFATSPSGMPILPSFNQVSAQMGVDRDAALRAFIGLNNQPYYLHYFQQFEREGKTSISWHWPAFFVSWFWLLYRKMWLAALIYFCLPFLIVAFGAGISGLSSSLGAFVNSILYIAYLVGIWVWLPMNATALYYKHVQQKIQEIKSTTTPDAQLSVIAWKGGTSGAVIFVILFFVFIPFIGILAAIALPAYQDYVVRAKVLQALVIGNQAEASVGQYYQQQARFPSSLDEAGFNMPLPPFVEKIELEDNAINGTIAITMADKQLPLNVQGQKVYLTPHLSPDKSITWTCSSSQIDVKFLPKSCR